MSGIAVFNKAVSTLQQSQRNLQAISMARQKMERDNELFKLKKQEAEIGLNKAKMEGKMSELEYDILSSQQKAYQKQEEDRMKGHIASIKMAEHQNKGVAEQALNWAKIGFKSDPQGVLGYLGAMKRNQERTRELRPKMSYGKIGFEEVDVENGEDAETEGDRLSLEGKRLDVDEKKRKRDGKYTEKEIMAEARAMAKDDGSSESYEQKLKKYLPIAREMLGGGAEGIEPVKKQGKSVEKSFDSDIESRILKDMKFYKKSREEIIAAYKKKKII